MLRDDPDQLNPDVVRARRFVNRVALSLLVVVLCLSAAAVTLVLCPTAPLLMVNRSDQAIEQLTISVLYRHRDTGEWSGREVWSGRLGPGAVWVTSFPMARPKWAPSEGVMAFSGIWADGRPIPLTYGPGYLDTFPFNHTLLLDAQQGRIVAQRATHWLKAAFSGEKLPGAFIFVDWLPIVLFCWLTWLAGPAGLALLGLAAGGFA